MKTKKFQLKNGLNVVLIESKKSPVVSAQMWVKTGSADEQKGEEGISHFIEHLVFKGSEKYKVGEIASIIEGSGGELNAYTSFDQTVFYITISKSFTDVALDVLFEMMGRPEFDADEIDKEREVVIEEIKRSNDNPHRQASRALFSTIYKKHPYGIPVIGYADNVNNMSREQILEYYQSRYVPENMTLVIVGDFETPVLSAEVKEKFSKIPKLKLKKRKRNQELEQKRSRLETVTGDFKETIMHIAWRGPKATHKDALALDLLTMILGQGDSSRLMSKLRIDEALTQYTVSSTFTPKDKGFLVVSSSLIMSKAEKALEVLNTELEKILTDEVLPEELEKVKSSVFSDEYYGMQTVGSLARKFGTYEDLFDDYRYFKKHLKDIGEIKASDLRKAARKYLNPNHMTTVVLSQEKEEAQAKALAKDFIKSYKKVYSKALAKRTTAKSVSNKKVKKITWKSSGKGDAKISKTQLGNGIEVSYLRTNETPVFSMRVAALGGLRAESRETQGLSELLSRCWVSDTESTTETELIEHIEAKSSAISAFSGRNTFGISLTTLSPYLNDILPSFDEVINSPLLSERVIERERGQLLEQLKQRDDNPAQICIRQFSSEFFGQHPYAFDSLGTKETLSGVDRAKIADYKEKYFNSENIKVSLVGDFDEDKLLPQIEKVLGSLPKGSKFNKEFDWNEPSETRSFFKESKKEQSHIFIGHKGLRLLDPERYTLQVIQSILSGQGGRLFLELRDKESLAYTVAPTHMEGLDAGYVGAYIACSPEKVDKSIEMLRAEFSKLRNNMVGPEELDRAKRYLIGRHDIDLQKNSSITASVLFDDIYGIPYDETWRFVEKISSVTSEDIKSLSERLFNTVETVSVVGQKSS